VEEKILSPQKRKKDLAAGVLGTDADFGKLLTEEDLVNLFQGE
jgi:SNF2 family DNA or RNA helicase